MCKEGREGGKGNRVQEGRRGERVEEEEGGNIREREVRIGHTQISQTKC